MRRNPRWRPASIFDFFSECRMTRRQREALQNRLGWGMYMVPTFPDTYEIPTAAPGCCQLSFNDWVVCIYDSRKENLSMRFSWLFEDQGLDCGVGLAPLRRASRPPSLCLHPHQWAARPGEQLAFPGPPPTLQGTP